MKHYIVDYIETGFTMPKCVTLQAEDMAEIKNAVFPRYARQNGIGEYKILKINKLK